MAGKQKGNRRMLGLEAKRLKCFQNWGVKIGTDTAEKSRRMNTEKYLLHLAMSITVTD